MCSQPVCMLARCGALNLLKRFKWFASATHEIFYVHAGCYAYHHELGSAQAVLRECGHEALQFYWFRSVVKLYNSACSSQTL